MSSIMVVDDKDLSLDLIHIYLSREGYKNIRKFDCPLKALSEIKGGFIPDFIITDFRMPEMNGVQFLKSVSSITSKPIPSLILTGDPGSLPPISKKITVLEKGQLEFFRDLISEVNKALHAEKAHYKVRNCSSRKKCVLKKRTITKRQKTIQSI